MNICEMNWYYFEAMQMEVDLLRRHYCIDKSIEDLMLSIGHEVKVTGYFSKELKEKAIEIYEFLQRENISKLYNECVELEEKQRI